MLFVSNRFFSLAVPLIFSVAMVACSSADAAHTAPLPDPIMDVQKTATPQKAVFAGGCFWGTQAVFEHVKGVTSVEAGYAGGDSSTAEYEVVSSGTTGHAE